MFATVQDFFARVGIPQDDYTQIGDSKWWKILNSGVISRFSECGFLLMRNILLKIGWMDTFEI